MTKPYAEVIGDPIAHSKSPLIHNFWLQKLGIDAEYRATHVRAEALADYFSQRREENSWRGCNVTIPHKVAALALVDRADGKARSVGAVNAIIPAADRSLMATSTDVDGILQALHGVSLVGLSVCMIGAGGAARSALHVLRMGKVQEILFVARHSARGRALLEEFGISGGVYPFDSCEAAFAGAELIVNASPLGMTGQPEMPDGLLDNLDLSMANAAVFDMVYAPLDTRLLMAARARNMHTADGLQMLVGQAADAFHLFFGEPAPREHDAELRALLTA